MHLLRFRDLLSVLSGEYAAEELVEDLCHVLVVADNMAFLVFQRANGRSCFRPLFHVGVKLPFSFAILASSFCQLLLMFPFCVSDHPSDLFLLYLILVSGAALPHLGPEPFFPPDCTEDFLREPSWAILVSPSPCWDIFSHHCVDMIPEHFPSFASRLVFHPLPPVDAGHVLSHAVPVGPIPVQLLFWVPTLHLVGYDFG